LAVLAIVAVYLFNVYYVQPVNSCYGPCVTSDIDNTQIILNENVTVTGQICPPEENRTVRVVFTRPDYTFIEKYVLTDPKTGNFAVTQTLGMAGYWNIFSINGAICDRLYAQVTDPLHPDAPSPTPAVKLNFKTDYTVVVAGLVLFALGTAAFIIGRRNKTAKISSLRLLVQIGLLLLIFFGIFIDHQNLPVPAEQVAPHEILIGTNVFGVSMPDGLPAPFFACFYPW
jgi:hypothetical protein